MKLFALNMGGTLGMIGKPLRPAKTAVELFKGIIVPPGVKVTLEDFPERRDSTNVPHALRIQAAQLIARVYDDYDSFLIMHGTDSLDSTAAALSMIYKDSLQKSIFVVGAQMSKDEAGSEVKMQLENAMRVAESFHRNNLVGVYNMTIGEVWLGARLRKRNEGDFSAVHTPGIHAVAKAWPHIKFSTFGLRSKSLAVRVQGLRLDVEFERLVAEGIVVSADTPPWLVMDQVRQGPKRMKGFLFICKGAGQITDIKWRDEKFNQKYSWVDVIAKATARGIHIGIVSPFEDGEVDLTRYELGEKAQKAGALSMGSMVPAMADFKFRQAIAKFPNDPKKIEEYCLTDIVGEQLPRTSDQPIKLLSI